jgi:hypothetical protein
MRFSSQSFLTQYNPGNLGTGQTNKIFSGLIDPI